MTFLIVDDAKINRYIIKRYLEKYNSSFIIDEVSNGEDAVEKSRYNDYTIIFMDIKMPGKYDGIQASNIIKAFKPNQIIIGLTGQVENTNVKSMYRILAKPTDRQELISIIEEILKVKDAHHLI
jgi:CheY-like chemotaxis protein